MLGSRGIPAGYGGFEAVARSLAEYLPKTGNVGLYVACESSLKSSNPNLFMVRTIYFPVVERARVVSEVLYDAISLVWCSFRSDVRVIYLLGYPASPFCIVPRVFGKKVIINVDGLEWKRRKWNRPARMALKMLERVAHYTANVKAFDSKTVQAIHEKMYGKHPSIFVPHCIDKYELGRPTRDYLVVARLEPENNITEIISAFKASGSKGHLVIVGDSGNSAYKRRLVDSARSSEQLSLRGSLYGEAVRDLRRSCFAYIHGHEVGGTNPSLLEAMSFGNLILAKDTPYNREVLESSGQFWENPEALARLIRQIEASNDARIYRERAYERAKDYDIEKVMKTYVEAFS